MNFMPLPSERNGGNRAGCAAMARGFPRECAKVVRADEMGCFTPHEGELER
jgi:hypothetical protein